MTYELKMPILGFDDVTKVELEQIDETFSKLHSLDGTRPFEITLVNPFSLCEYNFTIPTADEKLLDLDETRGDKVLVFCVVVVQKPIANSIVNLMAPFVFNPSNASCLQVTTLPVAEYPQFSKVQPLKEFLSPEILQTLSK
ncbi:flagellar assembly protein FliW [Helicobacter cinaedi PAGU611]|uniref:Flagellar assembly factor FliW n=2 Tax=Helicobacter cinaedi TaxID=213 RepID=A0AAI8MLI6_9HELI|nr:flagellar assembly protein FliW [Helicobacter cinaedi]AWK61047.1 flagellar biosynthesis protein FliW [Helicobacter cinaedi]EFR47457.1 protein FliW [Helicobacter cinaedi CCUG 18818 = ATCC BAA-847]QOQ90389.1 flagellar assembly protein FliW [Helicobacter cinaedi]QOQ96559.1 flagellar assembly protein FliW [Helicobacter cinaedi]BAM11511.1 flagellar assembly protein FliW [Helicobacter cinaedi PAGU611]